MSYRNLKADSRGVRHAVIFDIDGVLCDSTPLMEEYKRQKDAEGIDWRNVPWLDYDPSGADHHPGWVTLCNMLYWSGFHIILLTARQWSKKEATEKWLQEHEVAWDTIIMWNPEDHSYEDYKEATVLRLRAAFHIKLAIDDDANHISRYDKLGIPALLAAPMEVSIDG